MVSSIHIPYDEINSADVRSILLQKAKEKNIDQLLLHQFPYYLNYLGLELSPEEEKQLHENFKWPEDPQWNSNTELYEEYLKRSVDFNKKVNEISKAERKFINDHINWASSARQTFYLGQLLFDKNLTAFDNLGDQEWLEKQSEDMQEYITKYIEKIKNSPLTAWNTRLNNAFKGGMRSMWSKKE